MEEGKIITAMVLGVNKKCMQSFDEKRLEEIVSVNGKVKVRQRNEFYQVNYD